MTDIERFTLNDSDLADLTPVEVRDLLLRYFSAAQKDAFDRAMRKLGKSFNEEGRRKTLEGIVRLAFREVGGSFEDPTPESLERVLHSLARRCRMMRTPGNIMEFDKAGILKAIRFLKKKH